jgi:hypothetical protein
VSKSHLANLLLEAAIDNAVAAATHSNGDD